MKKIFLNKRNVLCFLIITFVCIILVSGLFTQNGNEAFSLQEDKSIIDLSETSNLFDKEIDSSYDLLNFDDSEDYVLVIFEDDSYAIFFKDTFEMLEYSNGGNPFGTNLLSDIYYAGPGNYFTKNNNEYVNLVSNERVNLSESERNTFSNATREKFANNSGKVEYKRSNDVKEVQESRNGPSFDDLIDIDNDNIGTRISNYHYFTADPWHGYNSDGSCGSVATQLLLSYNNYYSDRRIVDSQYFLSSTNNINNCSDPMLLSSELLGTNDNYYSYIKTKVEGNNGSTIYSIEDGITDILDARNNINFSVSKDFAHLGISYSSITNKIDADRPVIVSLAGYLGGTDDLFSGHVVVAYGYCNYTYSDGQGTYSGYITHFGWSRRNSEMTGRGIHSWVNYAWCNGYVDLQVNHTHTYTNIGGDYFEEKCSVCNYRRYAYTTNILSNTTVEITGTHQDMDGVYFLPSTINGRSVTKIGTDAFSEQEDLTTITIPETVTEIGQYAFFGDTSLTYISIPNSVTSIGSYAFAMTGLSGITLPNSLTRIEPYTFWFTTMNNVILPTTSNFNFIGEGAFMLCANLKNIVLPTNNNFVIQSNAFRDCTKLEYMFLPNTISTMGANVFRNCNKLTLYTTLSSAPNAWHSDWNYSNRPVVWGCTMDGKRVSDFQKSTSNPTNQSATNGVNNPYGSGIDFLGWYTTSNFSGTKYDDIASAPNGTLYAKWDTSSCIAAGSLITLADGTQVAVEDLTGNEYLLVWNMITGQFDSAPILFIDSDPSATYDIIELTFSDGTTVKVIDEHAFFDMTLGEYVFLRSDAAQYIGHYFNKQSYDNNDNMIYTSVQLTGVSLYTQVTTAWSPVTYGHLCYYVNGMLSMPGATEGLINIFDVDVTLMKYDATLMASDISTYGLYTYSEFNAIIPLPQILFDAFNGQYMKVAIGKGPTTLSKLEALVNRYSAFVE